MGLRSDVQTDIGAAFDGPLADAVVALTVRSVSNDSYDEETGVLIKTIVEHVTRGVIDTPDDQEVTDTNIRGSRSQAIILQNELAYTPKINDDLLAATSREWRITGVTEDPAHSAWFLDILEGHDDA